eukprot:GFUD01114105.1.p1 GENE.GFUD01114105.1~~GFUD01114105.1.p1  ORF type:complete len:173 (+),score=25.33 GFUD01114105.1:159-677(+)
MAEVEEKTEEAMKKWLTTFQGWGLLSTTSIPDKQGNFLHSVVRARNNWNEATDGPYSAEKIFVTIKSNWEFQQFLPSLWGRFVDLGLSTGSRKKCFTIFLKKGGWRTLEIKFEVEKKRVNTSLLDQTTEAVAQQMQIGDNIARLEIPLTLFEKVKDKFKDAEWVRSHGELPN